MSFRTLTERFDLDRVQPNGAVFDRERLDWLNGQWIRRLPDAELVERTLPFLLRSVEDAASAGTAVRMPDADSLTDLLPLVRERLPRLDAIGPMVDFVFLDDIAIDPSLVVPKRWDSGTTSEGLLAARAAIAALGEVSFEAEELEAALRAVCDERGWKPGDLFMAVRVAITGRTATPPLFDTMVCLGYARTLDRLDSARAALDAAAGT